MAAMDADRKRELKREFKGGQRADTGQAMVVAEAQLNDLLDYLDDHVSRNGCDHSLRLTQAWAAEHSVDSPALIASLAHFGGYCDCEVAANVDPDAIF